jgi:hypothetical protein
VRGTKLEQFYGSKWSKLRRERTKDVRFRVEIVAKPLI